MKGNDKHQIQNNSHRWKGKEWPGGFNIIGDILFFKLDRRYMVSIILFYILIYAFSILKNLKVVATEVISK